MAKVVEPEMVRLVHIGTNDDRVVVSVRADRAEAKLATGVFEYEDEKAQAAVVKARQGSAAERAAAKEAALQEAEVDDGVDLDEMEYEEMTVPQLKRHASDRGVDLGGATRKADIIEVLAAADDSE